MATDAGFTSVSAHSCSPSTVVVAVNQATDTRTSAGPAITNATEPNCPRRRRAQHEPVERPVTRHATGSFDVKVIPQGTPDTADGIALGRMTIDKQYHGPLDATAKGEMLTGMNAGTGAAAYVAIERVTGTLDGRRGSFVLMHNGTMSRDGQQLAVVVAAASGTGQLTGLSGSLAIIIANGKHSYDLEYSLPAGS